MAIIRLLPVSENMGLALVASSSARQNLNTLRILLDLPEVAISDDWRDRLRSRLNRVGGSQEDRNRILHNPFVATDDGYMVLFDKSSGRVAMPVNVATIDAWAVEANEHAVWFSTVPHGDYSKHIWGKEWPAYQPKDWPARPVK